LKKANELAAKNKAKQSEPNKELILNKLMESLPKGSHEKFKEWANKQDEVPSTEKLKAWIDSEIQIIASATENTGESKETTEQSAD
jgi:hypothetical protein